LRSGYDVILCTRCDFRFP